MWLLQSYLEISNANGVIDQILHPEMIYCRIPVQSMVVALVIAVFDDQRKLM
jgi:hypothetical protein